MNKSTRPVLDWVFDHKWAITPNALETIVKIISADGNTGSYSKEQMEMYKTMHQVDSSTLSTLQAQNGEPLSGAERATLIGDTAIIPVLGPIFPRANLFTQLSGATSINTLTNDLDVALKSQTVKNIVLNIDSPGGEVTGVAEFADAVYAARSKKNIIAYVYGMAASAAYWIGSSATRMVIAQTGEVGSIGVVCVFRDTSEKDAKAGVQNIEIVSSVSPNKRPNIKSAEGRTEIQNIVDELADIFVLTVARNRDVSTETVLRDFGGGGMRIGNTAVDLGMADSVGSLTGVLSNKPSRKIQNQKTGGFVMDKETLKAEHPDLYNAVLEEGRKSAEGPNADNLQSARAEAAAAERARIQKISALEAPGFEAVIQAGMFDPECTADSVATKVLQAQTEKRKQMEGGVQDDGTALGARLSGLGQQPHTTSGDAQTDSEKAEATAARVAAAANKTKNRKY
jgi:ClpP class serine protease